MELRRNPAFLRLWIGGGISNIGDGVRFSALPLFAVTLTTDARLIAGLTAAQFLPWIMLGAIGGALVDRWNRRRLILTTQLARALVMAVFTVLVLTDLVAIWQLYVVAFLITAGEILVDPAVGAVVPKVVERDQLDDANGKMLGTEIVANEFAGAPLGAVAFAAAAPLPFGADAISYLGSSAALWSMPDTDADRPPPTTGSSLWTEIVEGASFLLGHPVLRPMALLIALYNAGAVAGFALLVLLATDVLGGSELTFGLLLSVGAVGATLGSFGAARLVARFDRRRVIVGGALVSALLLLAVSLSPTLPALFVTWFLIAIPAGAVLPVARAVQQRLTPNRLLGRVNTVGRSLTRGSMVLGALIAGVIADWASVRTAMGIGAAVEGVAAMALAWALRHSDL